MRRSVVLVLALLSAAACVHPPPPLPPPSGIAVFTRHARYLSASLSPGGTYLAAISEESGRRRLAFFNLKTRRAASTFAPYPETVLAYHWVNDGRVAVQLGTDGGTLAVPASLGEIYAVDAAGGAGAMIFGPQSIDPGSRVLVGGEFLSRLRSTGRHIVVETRDTMESQDGVERLYKVDAYSGRAEMLVSSPVPGLVSFLADEEGEPRVALAPTADAGTRSFYREPGRAWTALPPKVGAPVGVNARRRALLYAQEAGNRFQLVEASIDTGVRTIIGESETAAPDPDLLVRDAATQEPVALFAEPDLPTWTFLQPAHPLARMLDGLLAGAPGSAVRLVGLTDDQKQAMVVVYSDRDPGRFLLVDTGGRVASEVVAERPWIQPAQMSAVTPFHFEASDGQRIHGYLTRPRASPEDAPPPLVVLPHGGPHGVRDRWEFNAEAQLLASWGIAVLQVNYRGSDGYGRAFREAGYGHWGDRMVQDIVDATRYAVEQGWADAHRICSYGASYGAYAAVQAAIVAPELFRCTVGYAGVYDLTLLATKGDTAGSSAARAYLGRVVGSAPDALRKVSPAWHADQLRVPVLLIHGAQDQRAPLVHAEALRAALVRQGRPPEWLVEPKEMHGFYDERARERMYARLVDFLYRNLLTEPAPDGALATIAGAAPALVDAAPATATPANPCSGVRQLRLLARDDDGFAVSARASVDGKPLGALPGIYAVPACAKELRVESGRAVSAGPVPPAALPHALLSVRVPVNRCERAAYWQDVALFGGIAGVSAGAVGYGGALAMRGNFRSVPPGATADREGAATNGRAFNVLGVLGLAVSAGALATWLAAPSVSAACEESR